MTRLVLWDIDGTLINNGGVSKMAYAHGFELLTGHLPTEPVVTDGRTDPAIMRSLFLRHGIDVPGDLSARVAEVMPQALADLVPVLRERGHALPGAREAIAALAGMPNVIQSVLSGNIAANAFTKLATFGLDHGLDFEVGGYGSDHEVRAELVAVARHRVVAKYGIGVAPRDVILIGDTPRDVDAGRLSGAFVIGVATGGFDMERLADEGADIVLADLVDTDRLLAAVRRDAS